MRRKPKVNGHAAAPVLRNLPVGWQWVRLEDLASPDSRSITDGPFGSNLKSEHYTDAGPRVIRLENIGHGLFIDKEAHISEAHYRRLHRHAVESGDLVIAILGSPLPRACLVPTTLGPAMVKADCIRFKPDAALVDNRFACWWINSREPQKAAEDAIHGVGRPRLGMQNVKDVMVPLAPRAEQTRIVAKIDELFSDIEAGEKALEHATLLVRRFRQSVLKGAVTGELTRDWRAKNLVRLKKEKKTGADLLAEILRKRRAAWEVAELARLTAKGKSPKDDKWKQKYVEPKGPNFEEFSELPEIPDGWTWACIGQIGDVSGGLTKNAARKSRPLTRPYLRVANVYANRLKLDEVLDIELAVGELDRVTLKVGDLLVVEGNGSPDQIGRVALWDGSIPDCVHQNHLIKVRFSDASYARHVLQWMLSGDGRTCIGKVASSTSGLHTLSISKIERLPVPIAPLDELCPISMACDEADTLASHSAEELERTRQVSRSLRQAILKSAFSGELVSQDPKDEPASALLARIWAERANRTATATMESAKPKQRRGRPKKVTESSDRQGKLL